MLTPYYYLTKRMELTEFVNIFSKKQLYFRNLNLKDFTF